MRIAVINQTKAFENDYGFYISDLLSDYAAWLGYEIDLADNFVRKNKSPLPENAIIGIDVKATSSLGLQWWYNAKLPGLLKKTGAQIVINLNGLLNIGLKLPQVLAVPDISFLKTNRKAIAPWQQLGTKNLGAYAKIAQTVITYSSHAAGIIQNLTGSHQSHTITIPFTASTDYTVREWHEKVTVKSKYSANKEFFLAILHDDRPELWLTALKAFSKFKKWQQSNMQLLLIPKYEQADAGVLNKMAAFKYKDDVQVLDGLSLQEQASLVATAYATLHLPASDADLMPMAEAIQCATPIIVAGNHSAKEYFSETGINVADADFELLGDAMISMYKNEDARNTMIENTKTFSEQFKADAIAKQLWERIEALAKK